ncbi:MAG: cupredoxin domain-containing protein [Rubrobacteraceae bacterium]
MIKNVVLILASALALGALFVALRPDSPGAGPEERMAEVRIRDGAMKPAEVSVGEGDRVTLRIESDTLAEFHVHGYDIEREVEPGEMSELSFEADITGRFEIEDHLAHSDEHDHAQDGAHSHGIGALVVEPR